MACVNNGNLYDTQICEAKMPPELTGGNSFASKVSKSTWFHVQSVQVLCDVSDVMIVLWELSFLPCEESCEVTKFAWQQLWQTVWQFALQNLVPLKLCILCFKACIGPRDPHPKDPCLSHQRKAVKFLNFKMQKTRKHMNNMNPGPQHTDAHGRGKKLNTAAWLILPNFTLLTVKFILKSIKIQKSEPPFQTSCAYPSFAIICLFCSSNLKQIWRFEFANGMKWSGEPRLIVSILTILEMSGL